MLSCFFLDIFYYENDFFKIQFIIVSLLAIFIHILFQMHISNYYNNH